MIWAGQLQSLGFAFTKIASITANLSKPGFLYVLTLTKVNTSAPLSWMGILNRTSCQWSQCLYLRKIQKVHGVAVALDQELSKDIKSLTYNLHKFLRVSHNFAFRSS